MIGTEVTIGPHYVGEIPEPLDLTVTDHDGLAMNVTGATGVTFKYLVDGGAEATCAATLVSSTGGVFRVTWDAAAFTTAGTLRGVCYFTLFGARLVAGVVTCRIVTPPATIS